MKLLFPVVSLFSLVASRTTQAQAPDSLWRWRAQSPITMHQTSRSGDQLLSTEGQLLLLSSDSGAVRWERSDIAACGQRRVGLLPACRVGDHDLAFSLFGPWLKLQSDKQLRLVDLATGRDIFDTAKLGFDRIGGTCTVTQRGLLVVWEETNDRPARAAGFDLARADTLWTAELPFSKKVVCLPIADLWLGYGEAADGAKLVAAIEATSGKSRWQSGDLAGEGWENDVDGLADTDSTAVLYVDKQGPARISLADGSLLWRTRELKGKKPGEIAYLHQATVYVIADDDVMAIDLAAGTVSWKQKDLGWGPTILAATPRGVLVSAGQLQVFGYSDGAPVWPKAWPFSKAASLQIGDTLFHVHGEKLLAIDLETGNERELATIDFDGKESPTELEMIDSVLVARSNQNLAAFDRGGKPRYQHYYRAPGLSFGQKALRIGVAAALTALSERQARSQARYNANMMALAHGGSPAWWYSQPLYRQYLPNLGTRFSSTRDADRYSYVYTDRGQPGRTGFSLVRLDKRTGRESGRIWSTERRPKYSLDGANHRVFLQTADDEITAFAFRGEGRPD